MPNFLDANIVLEILEKSRISKTYKQLYLAKKNYYCKEKSMKKYT